MQTASIFFVDLWFILNGSERNFYQLTRNCVASVIIAGITAVEKSLQRFLPKPYPSQSTDLPSRNLTGIVGNLWYSPRLRLISRDPLDPHKDELPSPFNQSKLLNPGGRGQLNVYDKGVMFPVLFCTSCLLMEMKHCSQTSPSLRNTRQLQPK